jgi:hypothetical protein
MNDTKTLLHEENPISLRSAFVQDDGHEVWFSLTSRWLTTAVPEPRNYGKSDSTIVYRRRRSYFSRLAIVPSGNIQKESFGRSLAFSKKRGFWGWIGFYIYRRIIISLEEDIKVMTFAHPPELRLLWADSGHSVALYLDGQPWAFIHEEKNHGYSKGILRPTVGNTWDQELFEQTFIER